MAPEGSRRAILHWILPALLVLAFAGQAFVTARQSSLANDEAKHLVTGWWLLRHGECCFGIDNSPLTAWFAVPLALSDDPAPRVERGPNAHRAGRALIFGSADPERVLLAARWMSILAGVGLLVAAFVLSNRLFGPPAGTVTLALLAFEPNLLAQFSLLSTDALLAVTAVVFLLAQDSLLRRPTLANACACGLALGLALCAKLTAAALLPAQLPLLLLYREEVRAQPMRLWVKRSALVGALALCTVWLGYGARLSPEPPFLAFPGLWDGFLQAQALGRKGLGAFLNGEVGRHWPSYFLECLALKTPLPTLLLWGLGVAAGATAALRRDGRRWVPLVMAAVFLAVGVTSRLNIGVRHVLPVYAFMAIACGSLWLASWPRLGRRGSAVVVAALLLASAVESIRHAPHPLAYFNQLAGGPRGGVRYLGDSNLDWGQDLSTLRRVMDEHGIDEVILAYMGNTDPEFYGIRYQYLPQMFFGSTQGDRIVDSAREVLAVSTNNLQGFLAPHIDYGWLWSREPFATAGYSIYLYDITGDAEAHEHLASIYRATRLPGLARKEAAKAAALRERSAARPPEPSP